MHVKNCVFILIIGYSTDASSESADSKSEDSDSADKHKYRQRTNPGLEGAIHHLFLTKRIPELSHDISNVESWILQHFSNVCTEIFQFATLEPVSRMLSTWKYIQPSASFHKERFAKYFVHEISNMENGDTVPIYVRKQNCTLLVTKAAIENEDSDDFFRVDMFRPSLPSETIMSSVGSLQVTFPESSDSVYNTKMLLSEVFAKQLYDLTVEEFEISMRTSMKADKKFMERREIADPFLVTDWILALLVPRCDDNYKKLKITKKIRDEVFCVRSAKAVPFRRSGMWTSIKVATHLKLLQIAGNHNDARIIYKCLLLRVFAEMCKQYAESGTSFQMDLVAQMMAKLGRRVRKLQKMSCDKKSDLSKEILYLWSSTLKYVHAVMTSLHETMRDIWKASCIPASSSDIIQTIKRTEDEYQDDLLHHIPWLNRYIAQDMTSEASQVSASKKLLKKGGTGSKSKERKETPLKEYYGVTTDNPDSLIRCTTYEDIIKQSKNATSIAQLRLWRADTEKYIKSKLESSLFENDSKGIFSLCLIYVKHAIQGYANVKRENPVGFSQTLLAVLKIIQILDQTATKKYPLLLEYKSGINPKNFDKLLLPHSKDMNLLDQILDYFHQRDKNAQYSGSLDKLLEPISPNSFTCRFASIDEEMSKLRLTILQDMEMRTAEKLLQVEKIHEECLKLQTEMQNCTACGEKNSPPREPGLKDICDAKLEPEYCKGCSKLEADLQKKRYSVPAYECPLPEEEHLQFAITFELMIPVEIKYLREGLALLKFDLLREQQSKLDGRGHVQLKWMDYRNIQSYKRNSDKSLAKSHQLHLNLSSKVLPTSSTHHIQIQNPDLVLDSSITFNPKEIFIVPNGLDCVYYHTSRDFLPKQEPLTKFCTFQLESTRPHTPWPSSQDDDIVAEDPYFPLQWALDSTKHSQNRIIAEFSSTHHPELVAFGSLRAGHRIQIMNLYRYIANRQLQLEKEPVVALLLQTLWQVGPREKVGGPRESHLDFMDSEFTNEFLEMLENLAGSNDTNYANPLILLNIIAITVRILELNGDCRERCYILLKQCRRCADSWLETIDNEISSKKSANGGDEDFSLIKVQLEIIMCSALSYNVLCNGNVDPDEENDMRNFVIKDGEDLMHWFQTLCRLHEITQESEKHILHLTQFEKLLLEFVKEIPLKLRLEENLSSKSKLHDLFVKSLHLFGCQKWDWAAGAGTWKLAEGSCNNIVGRFQTDTLTFDLFHGTFLVNGYSRTSIPISILHDSLFELYFQSSKKLSVVQGPITVNGDQSCKTVLFRTLDKFYGKHYEFELIPSSDAVSIREVQEGKNKLSKLQLINPEKFRGFVSDELIYRYTHWIDLAEKVVYFRRLPLQESDYLLPPEFTLKFCGQTNRWRLHDNVHSQFILCRKSKGFKFITLSLARIELETYINVVMKITDRNKGTEDESRDVGPKVEITVKLPRYQLNFSLVKGYLCSMEYKGFKIASNQMDRGTFIGLKQGILLDSKMESEEDRETPSSTPVAVVKRIFIAPHGTISAHFATGHKHQRTEIDLTHLRQPSFFCYEFDPTLKRLKADRSKCAWIYLAALHGATSSCAPSLPDPFLEMTGTEMAVQILQSGFVWSCSPYDEESLRSLRIIRNFAPRREYYGHGLLSPPQFGSPRKGQAITTDTSSSNSGSEQMETTEWPTGLPSMVAYDGYAIVVDKLVEDSFKLSMLYPAELSKVENKVKDFLESTMQLSEKLSARAYYRHLSAYNKAVAVKPNYFRKSFKNFNESAILPELLLRNRGHSTEDEDAVGEKQKLQLDLLLRMSQARFVFTLESPMDASKLRSNLSQFLLSPKSTGDVSTNAAKGEEILRPALPLPQSSRSGVPLKQLLNWTLAQNWLQFYMMAVRWTNTPDEKQAFSIVLNALAYQGAPMDQLLNLHNISVLAENINFPQLPESLSHSAFIELTTLNDYPDEQIRAFLNDKVRGSGGARIYENGEVRLYKYHEMMSEENKNKVEKYEANLALDDKIDYIMAEINNLWPCEKIPRKKLDEIYLGTEKLWSYCDLKEMNLMITKAYQNFQLKQFIESVESYLNKFYEHFPNVPKNNRQFDMMKQLRLDVQLVPPKPSAVGLLEDISALTVGGNLDEAGIIFFSGSAFQETNVELLIPTQREQCILKIDAYTNRLQKCVGGGSSSKQVIQMSGLAPRTSPILLLQYLIHGLRAPPGSVNAGLLKLLGALAVLWTEMKRFDRLIDLIQSKETTAPGLKLELENTGHENWSPVDYPEWLLLELEMDIMIRPIQVEVAQQMMKMPDGKNGVMQLNMGEGKTSVIIPMLCVTLANEEDTLCRITVLNSIFKTNLSLLSFAIGGITLSRRVYTFPCRRDMKFSIGSVDNILECYQECLKSKGAVLTLPEYRLSFRLLAYDQSLKGYPEVGVKFLEIENGLRRYCRDILDESDELLSAKYQLVYTIGTQIPVDGGNLRWVTCQKLLQIVQDVAWVFLGKMGPSAVEFHKDHQQRYPEQFAYIRLLDKNAHEEFVSLVADELLKELKLTERQKQTVKKFLIQERISSENFKSAMSLFKNDANQLDEVRILSGYLRRGILALALSKRWRVDYGVDPGGSHYRRMAVPFRAKDFAAERTEFGHPDLAIVLTHLSYYYSGLSDSELMECFTALSLKQDAETIYSSWMGRISALEKVPKFLANYAGVNLQDAYQRLNLFNLIRKNKSIIDFWLSHKVFPEECKQFPGKITMTSWDLCYERHQLPVTGFSGTNDSSILLPLPISQQDLTVLKETNEKMERTLLKSENAHHKGFQMGVTCREILEEMKRNSLKVLIDSGAIMLECDNEQVAQLWLEIDPDIAAVVYFSKYNELLVKVRKDCSATEAHEIHPQKFKRNSRKFNWLHRQPYQHYDVPLELSPYRHRLDKCAVFLDDQHTRGTDLKFPAGSKACVTIGSRMRRDKLMQACMRMRQLGYGHSVTFYLSNEACSKVLEMETKKSSNNKMKGDQGRKSSEITTESVLRWVTQNTQEHNHDGLIYWATSGKNYAQKLAAQDFHDTVDTHALEKIHTLSRQCLDDEVVTLKDLYGTYTEAELLTKLIPAWFEQTQRKLLSIDGCYSLSQRITRTFDAIRNGIQSRVQDQIPDKTYLSGGLTAVEEEQEKEVEQEKETEIEEERQLVQPKKMDHVETSSLHENVKQTVLQCLKVSEKPGISHISGIFEKTSFSKIIQPEGWASAEVYVTADFISVIKPPLLENVDNKTDDPLVTHFKTDYHLRPIEYVVSLRPPSQKVASSNSKKKAVISASPLQILVLSPFEVNELLPFFRNGTAKSQLHMFTPRHFPHQSLLLNNTSLQVPRPLVLQAQNAPVLLNIIPDESKCLTALLLASGNLYFENMQEQSTFAQFLGMVPRPWSAEQMNAFEKEMIKKTGFLLPKHRRQNMDCCGIEQNAFQKDPGGMVRRILMCRHAIVGDATHVSRLLNQNWLVEL